MVDHAHNPNIEEAKAERSQRVQDQSGLLSQKQNLKLQTKQTISPI